MVDKKKLFSMGDEIQATIRAGDLDRAVELLEEFLDQEGADRRWGLSLLQTVLKRMRENGVDAETDAALLEQEQSIRDEILSMNGDNEAWMHQWERARQLNNQAWQEYEAAKSNEELRSALALAEQSLEFWPYFLPHLDTKVRCLLKLGRTGEAFACVRWADASRTGPTSTTSGPTPNTGTARSSCPTAWPLFTKCFLNSIRTRHRPPTSRSTTPNGCSCAVCATGRTNGTGRATRR